jgi:nitroreductase
VKKLLNLPEAYRVIALLPIGVPAYEPHASRNRLRDLLHDNRYTATRDD